MRPDLASIRRGTRPIFPADLNGSATWSGVMVGRDTLSGAFVQGDALVTVTSLTPLGNRKGL